MFIIKDKKPNLFQITFGDQSAMTVMTLLKLVLPIMCLYSSMYVRLKLFGYDKLLESVLRLMYICVIDNVH